jgi:hypothetical protein
MKTITFASFAALLDEFAQAFLKAARYTMGAVVRMSWPALLACCVTLALAITVLPLALFLFIAFMLVKLIVGAIVIHARMRRK